jgi:hypothetical protein
MIVFRPDFLTASITHRKTAFTWRFVFTGPMALGLATRVTKEDVAYRSDVE